MLAGAFGLLVLCAPAAHAATGSLAGRVTCLETPVPGAKIELLRGARVIKRVKSAGTGDFVFAGLKPAQYRIRVKPAKKKGLGGNEEKAAVGRGSQTYLNLQVPDITPPNAPTNLKVTKGQGGTSTQLLSWRASRDNWGDVAYELEVKAGDSQSAVEQYTSTSANRTNLLPATRYIYRIRAIDTAGNASAWSTTVSLETDATMNLSGTVKQDIDEQPIDSIDVYLRRSGGSTPIAHVTTVDGGKYGFWGLTTGTYEITVGTTGRLTSTQQVTIADPRRRETVNFVLARPRKGWWTETETFSVDGNIGSLTADRHRNLLALGLWSAESGVYLYQANGQLTGSIRTIPPQTLAVLPDPTKGYIVGGRRQTWLVDGNSTQQGPRLDFIDLAGDGQGATIGAVGTSLYLLGGKEWTEFRYADKLAEILSVAVEPYSHYVGTADKAIRRIPAGNELDLSRSVTTQLGFVPGKMTVDTNTASLFVTAESGNRIVILDSETLEIEDYLTLPSSVLQVSGLTVLGNKLYVASGNTVFTFTNIRPN